MIQVVAHRDRWAKAARAIAERTPLWSRARLVAMEGHGDFASATPAPFHVWPSFERDLEAFVAFAEAETRCFGDIERDEIVVVILPDTCQAPVDAMAAAVRQASSRAMVDGMARASAAGARLILIPEGALYQGDGGGFVASLAELRATGERLLRRLSGAQALAIDLGATVLPLTSLEWECETTDPTLDRIVQLPGGEVFAHFECDWNVVLPVRAPSEGAWQTYGVEVMAGRVGAVFEPNGLRRRGRLMGRPIVEVGIGTNPTLTFEPNTWAEKCHGRIHVGVGLRIEEDLGPPDVHFDLSVDGSLICDGEAAL